jgi:hypothetical protein
MTELHMGHEPLEPRERTDAEINAGTSTAEVLAGTTAVVLSVLGWLGIAPLIMGSIAGLCIGGAILFAARGFAGRFRAHRGERRNVPSGTFTIACAAIGTVLALIALFGVAPYVLLSLCCAFLGGSVMLKSGVKGIDVRSFTGVKALTGFVAVLLGLVTLATVTAPFDLVSVAFIALGAVLVLDGAAKEDRSFVETEPISH